MKKKPPSLSIDLPGTYYRTKQRRTLRKEALLSRQEKIELLKSQATIGPGGCLLWAGASSTIKVSGEKARAQAVHRASYEVFTGESLQGKTLRNLCGHKNCLNPSHWIVHVKPPETLPTFGQASRIIRAFGGPAVLARLLGVPDSTVCRWTYSKASRKGTDGIIPARALKQILPLARLHGILLTPEILDPTTPYAPPLTDEEDPYNVDDED
jgi:hypothetical protein